MDEVLKRIDKGELVQLVLDLCNAPSPPGDEGPAGEVAYQWLRLNGFPARKLGFLDNRFCVVGEFKGAGGGPTLIFNSHLDTAFRPDSGRILLNPEDPIYHSAWTEEDRVVGEGAVNDKGPMACWMIALKAIKESGLQLAGDIVMTMVPGEIGQQPVDEFQGPGYLDKEVSTQYAIAHGAIGDYALVAEASEFGVSWIECGKAFFKLTITVPNKPIYTPMLPSYTSLQESPNPIERAAPLISAFREWAADYEVKHRFESSSGTVIPKAMIGAIRGGTPHQFVSSPQLCSLYIDCRIPPGNNPLSIKRELEELLKKLDYEGMVETVIFRPGYEADIERIQPLYQAVRKAHRGVFGTDPEFAKPPHLSMWRDINAFNQVGIPSLNYGPRPLDRTAIEIDDLMRAAQIYALTALNLCGIVK